MKLEEPSDGGRARFRNSIPASGWQPFRSFRDFARRAPAMPRTFVFAMIASLCVPAVAGATTVAGARFRGAAQTRCRCNGP